MILYVRPKLHRIIILEFYDSRIISLAIKAELYYIQNMTMYRIETIL